MRLLFLAFACAAFACTCLAFAMWTPSTSSLVSTVEPGSVTFDSTRWKELRTDTERMRIGERAGMLPSLVRAHKLIGRAREDIEQLLGEPSSESWSPFAPHPGYVVGTVERFIDVDTVGLIIAYDEQGQCIGYVGPGVSGGVDVRTEDAIKSIEQWRQRTSDQ